MMPTAFLYSNLLSTSSRKGFRNISLDNNLVSSTSSRSYETSAAALSDEATSIPISRRESDSANPEAIAEPMELINGHNNRTQPDTNSIRAELSGIRAISADKSASVSLVHLTTEPFGNRTDAISPRYGTAIEMLRCPAKTNAQYRSISRVSKIEFPSREESEAWSSEAE